MSIIITEEDLCKKHAKKCAKICQFSSLPSKWFQAVNDPNTKIDSKPHICAYNYNTRTGFRDHKKTWGPRVLSSALVEGGRPDLECRLSLAFHSYFIAELRVLKFAKYKIVRRSITLIILQIRFDILSCGRNAESGASCYHDWPPAGGGVARCV